MIIKDSERPGAWTTLKYIFRRESTTLVSILEHLSVSKYISDVDRWMEKGRVDTTAIDVDYTG